MSQIKAKQIKLQNQGDLIIGNSNGNGSILSIGVEDQTLHVTGSAALWRYNEKLFDSAGNLVLKAGSSVGSVNYFTVTGATSGNSPSIEATGFDLNIDINLTPKGTGQVLLPSGYTSNISSPNAVVNKQYVDSLITGLDWKNSVKVATTSSSDLSGYTYNPTNEPVGFVWTGVAVAPTIDGITLSNGDRLLIKNSPDARGNGIFVYDAANQAFVRAEDANTSDEVSDGLAVFVEQGTVNASTGWLITSPDGPANFGTDNIIFTQFAGQNLYVAGSGLSLTGNVFSVNDSTTIGIDGSNNVIVRSNNVNGNVLISTGLAGQEASWGPLDLSNANSVTNSLKVVNGGTGLSAVPSGAILYGNGTDNLRTLSIGPASTNNLAYVLQTNSTGEAPQWSTLTLNKLLDVSVPSPNFEDILTFDGTEWVAVNTNQLDRLVRVSNNDTTSGYLSDKLVAATNGALQFTIANPSGYEDYVVSVRVDNTTVRINGGNDLAVGNGANNQVLIGQGAGNDAVWSYLNTLRNSSGNALFTVNGTNVSGATTLSAGVNSTDLTVGGGDFNIITTSGNIILNGVRFPSPVPERSVLVANTNNVLIALQASPNENQLLQWNVALSAFEFIDTSAVAGNSFTVFSFNGNASGGNLVADSASDTLTVSAGVGITLVSEPATDKVNISFSRDGMTEVAVQLADTLPYFDSSNSNKPEYRSFVGLFSDLDVPFNIIFDGLLTRTANDTYTSRMILASTDDEKLGISVDNGNGVAGNPTIGLDIKGLPLNPGQPEPIDTIAMYSKSLDKNFFVSFDDIFSSLLISANFKWQSITDGTTTIFALYPNDALTVVGSGIFLGLNPAARRIEFNINIASLSPITVSGTQASAYSILVYNGTNGHRVTNLQTAVISQVKESYASANATGAANESFIGFFANSNIVDENVKVYFNGLALKRGGWTRTGTTLTLVDSVNGYSTEPGDVITATYLVQ
jgi:hypothetical protein